MWVKSEYAGELAVISAWLTVLLPWTISFRPVGPIGEMLFVYFPFFQVQYTWLNIDASFGQSGLRVANNVWIADPISAALFYQGGGSATANFAWVGAAVLFLLAFALSLALYFREDRIVAAPFDEVRTIGALLGLGAVTTLVATGLFWQNSPGTHIPVGAVIVLVLAGILLTIDRVDSTDSRATDDESDAESA